MNAVLNKKKCTVTFDHYEDVPKSVQEEIIKKNSGEA